MLNAIQFLVGSSQHVFFCIFFKKILLTQQAKFQIYWKSYLYDEKGGKHYK